MTSRLAAAAARVLNPLLLSVPGVYFTLTRLRDPAAWATLLLMEWGAALTLVLLARGPSWISVGTYFVGYLAFITFYEVGYIVNDAHAVKLEAAPRLRWKRGFGAPAVPIAFGVRLVLLVVLVALVPGLRTLPVLVGYAVLGVAWWVHNGVADRSTRVLSFGNLAFLRFILPTLPVAGAVAAPFLPVVLASYVGPRALGYIESKNLAEFPGRRTPVFRLRAALAGFGVAAVSAALASEPAVLGFGAYFLALHGGALLAGRLRARLLGPPASTDNGA